MDYLYQKCKHLNQSASCTINDMRYEGKLNIMHDNEARNIE